MSRHHLAAYVEDSAVRWPTRTAIVQPDGQFITYLELNRRADALAGFLQSRGVGRGDRIAIVLPKGISAVVALLATLKTGAAYVPVDTSAPAERSRNIITDCQIHAVIADSRSLAAIPATISASLKVIVIEGALADQVVPEQNWTPFGTALHHDAVRAVERRPDDLAYIIYTSGSTGTPKGAMISHRNATSYIDTCSQLMCPTEQDRFSSHPPFHFDASVHDIYLTLKHGASMHLIPEALGKNPRELARYIAAQRLTVWTSTPSTLILLLQNGVLADVNGASIRLVIFGGEIFPLKHLRGLKRLWPSAVFMNMYGPTETTTACTYLRLPDHISEDRELPFGIGAPCPHCSAAVMNPEKEPVEPGTEGLLHISGPSVFEGYWNRPAETALAFHERDGVRWYNTGDIVRWTPDEGFVFAGRNDRMVKRRGYRIELGEVERALYEHEKLGEVAVIALPDPETGARIIAFMTSADGSTPPSLIELKTFCGTKLPAYMIPDRFVVQDRLPKTSTDKVDYQTLKAQISLAHVA